MRGERDSGRIEARLETLQAELLAVALSLRAELAGSSAEGERGAPVVDTARAAKREGGVPFPDIAHATKHEERGGPAVILSLAPVRAAHGRRSSSGKVSAGSPGAEIVRLPCAMQGRDETGMAVDALRKTCARERDRAERLDDAIADLAVRARTGGLVARLADNLAWILACRARLAGEPGTGPDCPVPAPATKKTWKEAPAGVRAPRWLDETERRCDSLQRRIETLAGEMAMPSR